MGEFLGVFHPHLTSLYAFLVSASKGAMSGIKKGSISIYKFIFLSLNDFQEAGSAHFLGGGEGVRGERVYLQPSFDSLKNI